MSSIRARGAASTRSSVEARESDEDVEMQDRPEDGSEDAEGEIESGASRDLYQMINELSTFLCSVEEE